MEYFHFLAGLPVPYFGRNKSLSMSVFDSDLLSVRGQRRIYLYAPVHEYDKYTIHNVRAAKNECLATKVYPT